LELAHPPVLLQQRAPVREREQAVLEPERLQL
jgi:hypothetical protein